MTPNFKNITTLAPSVLLVTTLASCGGGGDVAVSPNLTYQGIVTSVPPVTYTLNDLLVSNQITTIRQGAGLLAQNTSLDTAASSHANFLVNNYLLSQIDYLTTTFGGILGGHYEDSVLPGYTGVSPQSRAAAAGYTGTITELMTFGAANGTECVVLLGDSVYHLIDLVSPFVDLGISFNMGNGSGSICAIEVGVGVDTLGQLPVSGNPVFYPYDGQTGVLPKFYNHAEAPDPAPDLEAGHPVVVSLYTLATPTLSGSDIVINTFTITPNGGTSLGVRVLANTGVTSTGPALTVDNVIPRAGFLVLLPTAPLTANTLYNLSFSATVKGQAVSKAWSFTTGAAN